MKKIFCLLLCCITINCFAQDSTKAKQKEWLGVLTLVEKYKEEKNWTAKEQGIVGEHFQRLLKMKEQGIIILAGRTNYEVNNPDMMGLVIFYAADDEAAQKIMMEDPAVKNNIMLAKVHPYGIAVNKCN
ncbi:MAG: YciI family protein [Bacteroidota bacterium]